jgi:hypothetical protein
MSLLATAVRVGITGEVYTADSGATVTAPTSSVSVLDSDLYGLGYVSEDGVEEAYEDTIEEIVAWQGAVVVRANTTGSKATLKFVLIETKGKVLQVYHPGSTVAVVSAGQWKMDVKAKLPDRRVYVLDVIDGAKHLRLYVPDGEVIEREPVTYANGEPIGYGVTLICYADAAGVLLTKFSDDANWGYS